jgi:hypothetical protein
MVKFSVAKATEFNLWGFILIMLAAVLSGFRWAMTQILLQVNIFRDVISFLFFGFCDFDWVSFLACPNLFVMKGFCCCCRCYFSYLLVHCLFGDL